MTYIVLKAPLNSNQPTNLYWDRRVSVSLSVCLLARVSPKAHDQPSHKFLYMLIVTVARHFSEDSATSYVLPVLWMTSYFYIMGRIKNNVMFWRVRQVAALEAEFAVYDCFVSLLRCRYIGVRSIVISMSVCLFICLLVCPSPLVCQKPRVQISPNFLYVTCGHGSVLLWRQWAMLCTSRFVMTSCFHIIAGIGQCQRGRECFVHFARCRHRQRCLPF